MKSFQVAHDLLRRKATLRFQYIEWAEWAAGRLLVWVNLSDVDEIP